jgi:hypothetical protein
VIGAESLRARDRGAVASASTVSVAIDGLTLTFDVEYFALAAIYCSSARRSSVRRWHYGRDGNDRLRGGADKATGDFLSRSDRPARFLVEGSWSYSHPSRDRSLVQRSINGSAFYATRPPTVAVANTGRRY